MRVGIDATPLLHGERAVRRNSRNLLKALVNHEEIDWRLLYLTARGIRREGWGRIGGYRKHQGGYAASAIICLSIMLAASYRFTVM